MRRPSSSSRPVLPARSLPSCCFASRRKPCGCCRGFGRSCSAWGSSRPVAGCRGQCLAPESGISSPALRAWPGPPGHMPIRPGPWRSPTASVSCSSPQSCFSASERTMSKLEAKGSEQKGAEHEAGDARCEPAGRFAYDGLDRVIHERARLSVLTSLVAHPKGLVLGDLKQMCCLTDGNLSRHLQVLEEAGLIAIEKDYAQNRPQTNCRITPQG